MYKVKEVAKKIKMSESYIRKELQNGNLPHTRFGNRYRISEEDIKRWKDKKQESQTQFQLNRLTNTKHMRRKLSVDDIFAKYEEN